MTVCGMKLVSARRAVIWADTECFGSDTNAPNGSSAQKLAVSATTATALVTAGLLELHRAAAAALHDSCSCDEAVTEMPGALRAALRDGCAASPDFAALAPAKATSIAMVGWSHRRRRLAGTIFLSECDFEPIEIWQFASPAVPLCWLGEGDHALINVAGAQLEALRRSYPAAQGGVLVAAEITGAAAPGPAVRCGPLWDFEAGRTIRWPPPDLKRDATDRKVHAGPLGGDPTQKHRAPMGAAAPAP